MLLCIDCGNTNTVFSVWDGAQFLCTLRTATDHQRTADQYYVWFSTLMGHHKIDIAITEVILSSTVPRVVFNLRVLCDRYFDCRPLVVGKPECLLPHAPRVDAGTQVGPDRLVNTAGAFERHGGDLIVVDFGTATTFDIVTANGDYEGGVIAPGVNLSAAALHSAAAMLPRVAISRAQSVIGKDTVPAMQSGLYWGYISLFEGLVLRIKEEFGAPMTVVATGGLANVFHAQTEAIDHYDPDLTMRGLMLIHAAQKAKKA